ncbi:LytTR family DNA-binding domain-containing protein [Novosphingobium sp. B 225]|uniref:LytTR family DNA-binding domain-containing protein n=1 Tax=Novosphingobium sp. B 225 TaxID=1961849 RepID=UPI000B4BBFB1|nr:LytTR family DNA-binding domain-containing protein [Novosphingobium sp. B 225]
MTGQGIESRAASLRQVVIDLTVMSVIGLVLAFLGPFGTFTAPFPVRLVYWLGLGWTGYCCFRPITGLANRIGARLDLPVPLPWVAACLIASLPMTAVVLLVNQLPGALHWPSLGGALAMYGYVLAVGAAVTTLFYVLGERAGTMPESSASSDSADAASPGARFLARIPPCQADDLFALEMEDHYLRVHTRHGSHLILLRMRDAVAELDGIAGLQVHRSWWVAHQAVTGTAREGRNLRLRLTGGLDVPVARDAAGRLKAAGWI